jgi:membrane-bound lytic murein transglycosylase D
MRAAAAALCVLVAAPPAAAAGFDRVPLLEDNVAFWRKVYAVWSSNDIALHDRRDLNVVWRVVRVPAHGRRVDGLTRTQAIKKAKNELITALASLNKKRPKSADGLRGVELEVYNNVKHIKGNGKYTPPHDQIRGQNGLYERARKGWQSLGRYEKGVRREITKSGMPDDILALAFVESLFNIRAVSHAGAAGMWQFMPATGRDYMHVNSVVDERIDPILAAEAAMKYLKSAKKMLGVWPLAITSYNYGRAGMKGASKAVGSKDFAVIYSTYKNKRFGFAAKNYYASFLALLDVIRAPRTYFGDAKQAPAWRYDVVRLPFPVLAPQLIKLGVINAEDLKSFNPALMRGAREGKVVLPRGLPMRVPYGTGAKFNDKVTNMSFAERKRALDHVGRWHKANGRQSLTTIAKRYRVDVDELVALTGMTPEDVARKGARIPVPTGSAGYSLLPEARGMDIPSAPRLPEHIAKAPRAVPTPPPETSAAKAKLVASIDDGPTVKLVRLKAVRVQQPLPAVDLVAGVDLPPIALVDAVAGAPAADAAWAYPLPPEAKTGSGRVKEEGGG